MRKICIATSTRADWGILTPLAVVLRQRDDVELQLLATNMHLLAEYGYTVDEIRAHGFRVDAEVPMRCDDDSDAARVRAMSQCLAGTAEALDKLRPDLLVILGDRYEMLAIASAAAVMRIPIAHIAGGEISEGAIDDSLRHAITKLATLHFTATEPYRQRVIQMGEDPRYVINAGALGVWNIVNQPLMTLDELNASLGTALSAGRYFVATYHSATLDAGSVKERAEAFLQALDAFPDYHAIITYPNNDTGSELIIDLINQYARAHSQRVTLVKSLGMVRYLSAVKYSAAVIGNSSSGIVEVPSLGVPTVDIGIRQQGRISAPSVIHADDTTGSIIEAIRRALQPDAQALAGKKQNPHYQPNTVGVIAEALASSPIPSLKKFYDR